MQNKYKLNLFHFIIIVFLLKTDFVLKFRSNTLIFFQIFYLICVYYVELQLYWHMTGSGHRFKYIGKFSIVLSQDFRKKLKKW